MVDPAQDVSCGVAHFKADQIVSAVAINLMVVGLTRFFLRLAFDSSSNSPRVAGFGSDGNAGIAATFENPLIWLES